MPDLPHSHGDEIGITVFLLRARFALVEDVVLSSIKDGSVVGVMVAFDFGQPRNCSSVLQSIVVAQALTARFDRVVRDSRLDKFVISIGLLREGQGVSRFSQAMGNSLVIH